MAIIKYEGVQSCFETTILKLKVTPVTSTDNKYDVRELTNFTRNISSTPSSPEKKQSPYTNPYSKTCPRLSQNSLDVCTENLGSETGNDAGADIDILSFNGSVEDSTRKDFNSDEEQKKMTLELKSRISGKENYCGFPPPLTSIRTSNPIQCRSHREDGRLIIVAFEKPSKNTYFQAQRTNGRLRLSFPNHCANYIDSDINNHIDFQDDDVIHNYESDVDDGNQYEGLEESDDDGDETNDVNIEEEIIGNMTEVEGEIGIEKFQRLSRCMEGGHQSQIFVVGGILRGWQHPKILSI